MSFFVDIVSEDSFYENLTLGVTRVLESNPCIKNVELERRGACDRSVLSSWEQKHCCLLTEDLRNFYTSTDGFLLTWSLEIAGEKFEIGRMEIKELSSLRRHVSGSKEQQATDNGATGAEAGTSVLEPSFGSSRSKLFELAECADCRVFLVYQLQPDRDEPSVWLYSLSKARWYQLADSFVKYFRIMLVHLGLPLWQMCAAGLQLPTWLEQVYLLVGPHLLQSTHMPAASSVESSLWNDGPINILDPTVFRGKDYQHAGAKQKMNATSSNGAAAATTTTMSSSNNARKKSSSH